MHPYTLPSRTKSGHTNQNLPKSMAAQTHGKIGDPNKTKNSTTNECKCLIMNKAQHLTMYIKHLAYSATFEAVTLNENCSGLTGLLSEMPNDFIYEPLMLHTAATQALRFLRFAPRNSQNLMKHQRCGAQKKLVVACTVSLRRTEA